MGAFNGWMIAHVGVPPFVVTLGAWSCGISTFWQGTCVGSFIIVAVLFDS